MRARYDDRTPAPYRHIISQRPRRRRLTHGYRMSIKDWPLNERPREKLLANGAHSLSDAELLAVLLGASGRRGQDAVAMARELLRRHQSLRGLLSAQRRDTLGAPAAAGLGSVGYCRLQAAVELARRHYAEAMRAGPPLDSPQATREFLIRRLRDTPHELFCCLHLDLCVVRGYVVRAQKSAENTGPCPDGAQH